MLTKASRTLVVCSLASLSTLACDMDGLPPPAPADLETASSDLTSGSVYTLKALNSGLCLDVTGKSTADGANIEQWTCNGGTNQQFKMVSVASGVFEIRAMNSNKCLDVVGTTSGSNVQQATCSGLSRQHWKATLLSGTTDRYTFNPMSSTSQCLDIFQSSTVSGGNVDTWSCNGHTSQTFTATVVSSGGGSGGSTGSGGATGGSGGATGGSGGSVGNFPARFSAPYVPTWNDTNLATLASSTVNKFWTLAFVLNRSGQTCTPSWNGDTSLTGNNFGSYITSLRNAGGDVIVSFGGADGTELARSCTTVSALQAAYQKVIDQFKLRWLDMDIEGATIGDSNATDRRNQAIHNLQAANPGLRISYTLAVDRTGLESTERNLLANAQSRGVTVNVVNIMAMDYGPCYSDMGQAAVDAAKATRSQLSNMGLASKVGVTPMIGTNDVTCEKFSTNDASVLVNFAQANSFIGLLAYWSQDADSSHSYINIFKTFH